MLAHNVEFGRKEWTRRAEAIGGQWERHSSCSGLNNAVDDDDEHLLAVYISHYKKNSPTITILPNASSERDTCDSSTKS